MATESYRPPEPHVYELGRFDPYDPVDCSLVDFQQAAGLDQLPTAIEQRELVAQIRQSDKVEARSAALQLVRSHRGLVAAVSHPYKGPVIESNKLLLSGSRALLQAALTYTMGKEDFADHAVSTIDAGLAAITPEACIGIIDSSPYRPMETILHYVYGLELPKKHEVISHRKALEPFDPATRKVLSLLTLPYEQIAKQLNISPGNVGDIVDRISARIDDSSSRAHNATGLALELHRRGVMYPVRNPEKSLVEILTNEEMEVAALLDLPYANIAEHMHATFRRIKGQVGFMKKKTGARTRTELALLVSMYDTGERRGSDGRPPSQSLYGKLGLTSLRDCNLELLFEESTNPRQRQAITTYYLQGVVVPWREVARQLDTDETSARGLANRGILAMRKAIQDGNYVTSEQAEQEYLAA